MVNMLTEKIIECCKIGYVGDVIDFEYRDSEKAKYTIKTNERILYEGHRNNRS